MAKRPISHLIQTAEQQKEEARRAFEAGEWDAADRFKEWSRKDGGDGLKASRKGKQAVAAAEFQQVEIEFNAMLKALGLPLL